MTYLLLHLQTNHSPRNERDYVIFMVGAIAQHMYGLVGGGNEYEQPYLFPSYPFPVLIVVRPASCGKYRYWNGERCVDARYQPPYVGPRW